MGQVEIYKTFLLALCCIYLIAFVSLYVQLPGLHGDYGILPVYTNVLKEEVHSVQQLLATQPSLVRLAPSFGLSYAQGAELAACLGCALALAACALPQLRSCVTFLLLWLLYLSLFHIGQTFMWFQWDILLLEAGFLAIGLSFQLPFRGAGSVGCGLRMFAVKWLLFRLMLASGVVKLTSGCPTWWGLTALDWHYESQCLPTPLAWYSHQLPHWFQALSVVATFVIEIAVPFLFFVPIGAIRKFCFFAQLLLQCSIIVSGNYNFFNLLTIALCLSLLKDDDFSASKSRRFIGLRLLERTAALLLLGGLAYYTVRLFTLTVGPGLQVNSKIAFSMEDLTKFNHNGIILSVYVGTACLLFEVASAVVGALRRCRGLLRKLLGTVQALLLGAFVAFVFTASLVPHTATDRSLQGSLPPGVHNLHRRLGGLEIVNSYGLFRRMTGVGGRPELVLEGSSQSQAGPWAAYGFAHKPGNLSRPPSIAAPHQPRLDWQMWFAALGTYEQNPWLLHLVHRLLSNEPSVTALLAENPFPPDRPPLYIRGVLYTYRYTRLGDPDSRRGHWWSRQLEREYLPPLAASSVGLARFLESQGVANGPPAAPKLPASPLVAAASTAAASVTEALRDAVGQPDGLRAVGAALATAACARMAARALLGT